MILIINQYNKKKYQNPKSVRLILYNIGHINETFKVIYS